MYEETQPGEQVIRQILKALSLEYVSHCYNILIQNDVSYCLL